MMPRSCRRFGFVTVLILLAVSSVAAFGAREAPDTEVPATEATVHGVDGGYVEENSVVVVVGRIALVGSEPNTQLIVRTDAPGGQGRWALEITGELAEQVFEHQNRVLRLEGRLDRVPAGAERGRLAVRSFVVLEH